MRVLVFLTILLGYGRFPFRLRMVKMAFLASVWLYNDGCKKKVPGNLEENGNWLEGVTLRENVLKYMMEFEYKDPKGLFLQG